LRLLAAIELVIAPEGFSNELCNAPHVEVAFSLTHSGRWENCRQLYKCAGLLSLKDVSDK